MHFDLDEDQALLKSSTRELLEKESPLAEARAVMEEAAEGYSKSLYAKLGELGYTSLLLPPESGGMGAVAFAAVLSEMGRVAFPGPFLELALAVRVLSGCEGRGGWADRAASGEALVVVARGEPRDVEQENLNARFEQGSIRGASRFVPFGAHADALLVPSREGLLLAERPGTGWRATPLPTIDHAQRFVDVELSGAATLLCGTDEMAAVLAEHDRLAALGASAMLLGLMERALEMTVEYTMEREAFGAPIATFQALQHRCADMLLQTESTRSAVFRAAWAEDCEPGEAPYLAAVAKAWAGPAARFVCGQALQLHGGVGYTWEYDPHIYLKRVKTLEQFHGSTRHQLDLALAASKL